MLMVFVVMALALLTTVWDGVYTTEQAARGQVVYDRQCSTCHGWDLAGRNARPLTGETFFRSWGEDSLSSLYTVVHDSMPRNAPGTLTDQEYLDIVAYLLQRNEYPAGSRELTRDLVPDVQVVGKNGPAPVPNFSLVRVVGCLEERPGGVWIVTRASEPARTRTPAPSTGDERSRSDASAPGAQEFELMDAYAATDGHSGKKVEVKGLLMRGPKSKLNFSSLQPLADSCP
jgi:mono/diheme cytochrome c family protein